jgi:DNA-binding beta-propeller fold protein YncE
MKQKIIIGTSVLLLILAVYLIASDLFRHNPGFTSSACCGDDISSYKKLDSSRIGYVRFNVFETGMHDLSGIATDDRDRVFVCGSGTICRFDTAGKKTLEFRTNSTAHCLAIHNTTIYIGTEAGVVCYDTAGNTVGKFYPLNNKGYITSVAADDEFVYAADAMNKIVLKYTVSGDLAAELGKKDSLTGAPGLIIPSLYLDIALGSFNDLWMVNPGRLELEDYSLSGSMRTSWGRNTCSTEPFMGCCNPAHMALLPDGSFVTYEKGIDKIKVYNQAGEFICFVAGAGSFKGNSDFQLGRNNLVKDLTTDSQGTIYILDAYNRINVFVKTAKEAETHEGKEKI